MEKESNIGDFIKKIKNKGLTIGPFKVSQNEDFFILNLGGVEQLHDYTPSIIKKLKKLIQIK